MPPEALQQMTVAFERLETITIITLIGSAALALAFQVIILYLLFGKVLIPVSNALCNYLDARAWAVDHQQKSNQGAGSGDEDERYKPKKV